jgi:hypothetical protein
MSNPAEELALEQMAARLGTTVTQLKMRMVMEGPGGRDVMRDIVEDNIPSLRRLREGQQAPKPKEPEPQKPRGTGWAPERPLGPLPGAATIDHMLDVAEARDRRELAQRLGVREPEYVTRMLGPVRGQGQPHQVQGPVSDAKEADPARPEPPRMRRS